MQGAPEDREAAGRRGGRLPEAGGTTGVPNHRDSLGFEPRGGVWHLEPKERTTAARERERGPTGAAEASGVAEAPVGRARATKRAQVICGGEASETPGRTTQNLAQSGSRVQKIIAAAVSKEPGQAMGHAGASVILQ